MKASLVWDKWNKEHIKKHNVTREEIEEAYEKALYTLPSYKSRTIILGQTKKKRLITIILSTEKQKHPYVVSARDMSIKERRFYNDKPNKTF